ncbi:hypothetical protein SDJN02_16532, partial [Cucurbita argyrosperma subsp. argyrosperma]
MAVFRTWKSPVPPRFWLLDKHGCTKTHSFQVSSPPRDRKRLGHLFVSTLRSQNRTQLCERSAN